MRPILSAHSIRLTLSVISGTAGQFVSLLAPLLVMPAMLNSLGDEAFGVWAASVAITGVMAFMDLGIGSGLLSRIPDAAARGDNASVRRDIASAYALLGSIAGVGLSAVLLVSVTGFFEYFVAPNMWPIAAAVLSVFFLGMPSVIIYRILQSLLWIPLQSTLQISGAIGSIFACLAAIYLNAPSWLIVLAYGGAPVLVMILASLCFFFREKQFKPGLQDFSFGDAKRLVGLGSHFFILSILTAIGTNADIIIISHLAGPAEVASFVPPMRLGSVMALLITQLFMPLWSFNAHAVARGDVAWVRRTTLFMSLGGVLLVIIVGLTITAFSDFIMMLWMHRTFAKQDAVLLAMTAASAVIAFTSPYNMVLNSQGRAKEQILPWLAFVVVSVALKMWLVTGDRTWLAPAITSICYLALVTPMMIFRARQIMASFELRKEN